MQVPTKARSGSHCLATFGTCLSATVAQRGLVVTYWIAHEDENTRKGDMCHRDDRGEDNAGCAVVARHETNVGE